MSLWSSVKEWCTRTKSPIIVQSIDPAFVHPAMPPKTIEANNGYLRIKLVQMVLGRNRNWFKDYQPSVHALVQLNFGDNAIQIPSVIAADQGMYTASSVFMNTNLLPLAPFRGGELEVQVALIAMPGDDRIANGIKALANVAGLIGTPISAALAIASKVKESADMLVGAGSPVHLAYRNSFSMQVGPSQLRDGYIAIVNAAPADFAIGTNFVVDNDQLKLWNGVTTVSLDGVDYMLLRVQLLDTRDDKAGFKDIEAARDAALTGYITATTPEKKADAEVAYRAALALLTRHPELINTDRRALAQQLQSELAPYRAADKPAQLAGNPRLRWAQFLDALPDVNDAAPVSLAEFMGK